jgi:hypothetical protein
MDQNREEILRVLRHFSTGVQMLSSEETKDLNQLANNYYNASIRLFETFKGTPADDKILNPYFYLLRHSVELRLKAVYKGSLVKSGSNDIEGKLKSVGHNMSKNFEKVISLAIGQPFLEGELKDISKLIDFLEEDGRGNEELRYGSLSSDDKGKIFDLTGLKVAVGDYWRRLDAVCAALEK